MRNSVRGTVRSGGEHMSLGSGQVPSLQLEENGEQARGLFKLRVQDKVPVLREVPLSTSSLINPSTACFPLTNRVPRRIFWLIRSTFFFFLFDSARASFSQSYRSIVQWYRKWLSQHWRHQFAFVMITFQGHTF